MKQEYVVAHGYTVLQETKKFHKSLIDERKYKEQLLFVCVDTTF